MRELPDSVKPIHLMGSLTLHPKYVKYQTVQSGHILEDPITEQSSARTTPHTIMLMLQGRDVKNKDVLGIRLLVHQNPAQLSFAEDMRLKNL